MLELIIHWLFRTAMYIGFGFFLEICVTGLSGILDGTITQEDKKLIGHISIWMALVYSVLLFFAFEPVFYFVKNLAFYYRYLIWCISFTGFEALSGLFFDKVMKLRPWDYRGCKTSIFNGYTKIAYFPLWGIAGLVIEKYSILAVGISPCVSSFILGK